MARALADWWDAVELWLTQLPFGFQVLLAAVVLVPLCWGAAVVVDRAVDAAAARIAARRAARRHDVTSSAPR
jgi:membrane protein required for beta-lactamase induction